MFDKFQKLIGKAIADHQRAATVGPSGYVVFDAQGNVIDSAVYDTKTGHQIVDGAVFSTNDINPK
jgi:hypothetical protein